jgi:hypothetical protein
MGGMIPEALFIVGKDMHVAFMLREILIFLNAANIVLQSKLLSQRN